MRSSIFAVMSVALVACGVFGSDDPDPEPATTPTPEEEKQKAEENSQAPAAGKPLVGIFVSSSKGNDEGSGSMERPLKTLARALALGKATGTRVLVCAEDYPESVTLVDGVSAFGNIDCKVSPWVSGSTARARIVSPTSPAVTAKDLKLPTKLESFEVIAPDLDGSPATDDAGTSIALDVRASTGLVVVASLLHAGKGAPGTDGTEGPVNVLAAAAEGVAAVDQAVNLPCNTMIVLDCGNVRVTGAAGGTPGCSIGPSGGPGGKGGDGRWYANNVEATVTAQFQGLPLVASASTAKGGVNASASGYGIGQSGAAGVPGGEGKDGANGVSSLTPAGFVRGNGTAGTAGDPAGGGGGGAGTAYQWNANGGFESPIPSPLQSPYRRTATGGSGGAGGCGGQPGTPATGGGASIGALLVGSSATFERTRVESSAGGRAGKGNLGTSGTAGGRGGNGTAHGGILTAGRGGDGGPGGNGGASGHGAPGPSIAIAYTEKPVLTAVDLAPGPAGEGQPELKRTGASGLVKVLPAAVGESKQEYVIKP